MNITKNKKDFVENITLWLMILFLLVFTLLGVDWYNNSSCERAYVNHIEKRSIIFDKNFSECGFNKTTTPAEFCGYLNYTTLFGKYYSDCSADVGLCGYYTTLCYKNTDRMFDLKYTFVNESGEQI